MEDPSDPGRVDRDVVMSGQVHRDFAWVEVVLLAEPEYLLDHFRVGLVGLVVGFAFGASHQTS